MYSQPEKDKKSKPRYSAPSDLPAKRNSLLTTFEKFQRMRPRKDPPSIMPLEGRSLIDPPNGNERYDRHERRTNQHSDRNSERGSVDESVRVNLQRISAHPIPSIPKQRSNKHKDIVLESSSYRRNGSTDTNNSAEDRIVQMQKQKQKLMKLRHEAREAERQKLMPQSFRIDNLSDEDRMNLDKLKDFYCIYYVPGPTSSPAESVVNGHVHFPKLKTNSSCNHSMMDDNESVCTSRSKKQVGFRVTSTNAVPPTACNCNCRMFVSGNKVETPFDQVEFSIKRTSAANSYQNAFLPSTPRRSIASNTASRDSMRSSTDKTMSRKSSSDKILIHRNSEKKKCDSVASEKRTIHVDMPTIVYNTSPNPSPDDMNPGLLKAYKQKELRQRELTNLTEDIRELNKMTEVVWRQWLETVRSVTIGNSRHLWLFISHSKWHMFL